MNIIDVIKRNNAENTTKVVMSIRYDNGESKALTYSEMFTDVDALSFTLTSIGLRPGDRVIIVAENSPEWVVSFLAISAALCTVVLIDPSLAGDEIVELIEASDARAILMSPTVKRKLNRRVSNEIPVLNLLENAAAFQGELGECKRSQPKTVDPDVTIAAIIYSSGTTKRAAGVMHTHDSLIGTTNAAIDFNNLNSNDKMLVVIPLYHIYGIITSMIGPLMLGASMHFIESMSGDKVMRAFSEYKPTIFACIPRVFDAFKEQILNKINAKGKPVAFMLKSLLPACKAARQNFGVNLGAKLFRSVHEAFGGQIRIFCAAGAPLDAETAYFYYAMGFNLFLNYGLTETNVPIIANNFTNYTLHSCGKPYNHVNVKIAEPDENGFGEILIKTPFMMKGYFRDEEATILSYDEDGWFKTGDIAAVDQKENISITGRIKDNIILSTGKKISPDHVEEKYFGIPGVKELVICGIPVASSSYDEIHAFIVIDEKAGVGAAAIEKELFAREAALSLHMKIRTVHFVKEIPRTSLQKPKRYVLRKNYLSGQASVSKADDKTNEYNKNINFEAELFRIINEIKNRDIHITHDMRLSSDLLLDSLDAMDLDARMEERTGKSIYNLLERDMAVGELIAALDAGYNSGGEKSNKLGLDFLKYPYKKSFLDYLTFSVVKFAAKILYEFEIKGLENLPKDGGFILCPNHETYIDAFFILMNLPKKYFEKMCCMAKKESLRGNNPISRACMRIGGIIPVDRTGNTVPAMKRCLEKLQESWIVLIHPEGTRTTTGVIGDFKPGASKLSLDSNKPIVPVRIKGAYSIYPKGQSLPKLFDIKKFRRYKLEIIFGSPIEPAEGDSSFLTLKLRDAILGM